MKNPHFLVFCFLIIALTGMALTAKHILPEGQTLSRVGTNMKRIPDDKKFFERNLNKRLLPFVLPDVYRIDVAKIKDSGAWQTYFSGRQPNYQPAIIASRTFTLEDKPRLLGMLQQCKDFDTLIPNYQNSSRIVIFCWTKHDLDAAPYPYVYIPEGRKIGSGNNWCNLPRNLNRQLANCLP